jgi:tRNA(adenine34) deaminase
MNNETDIKFMAKALELAEEAASKGEVPVGCVIVKDGEVIAEAANSTVEDRNPLAHAEMKALNAAIAKTGWRLTDCDMYVTLEPCSMCAGAIVHSRIRRLVIAAKDPKAGACGSVLDITENEALNHRLEAEFGVLEAESSALLKEFFKQLRDSKKQ